MNREDRELLTELARLNTAMPSLAMGFMEGTAVLEFILESGGMQQMGMVIIGLARHSAQCPCRSCAGVGGVSDAG